MYNIKQDIIMLILTEDRKEDRGWYWQTINFRGTSNNKCMFIINKINVIIIIIIKLFTVERFSVLNNAIT